MSERRRTSPALMVWMGATYLFLYAPILVLAVFSFNDSRLLAVWRGFTWRWYEAVLDNQPMLEALRTSLLIAALTTLVATLLGTSAALAFERWRGRARPLVEALFVLPIVVPEVVVGFASVTFFGWIGMRLGLGTVLLAHVAFSLSYVFFVVRARLATLDPRLEEAALDLGADPWRAFWRITLPLLAPAIAASALLVFTLSLDDYVITSFVAGAGATTLPVRLYSMIKTGITPEVNAISTLLLVTTLVLMAVAFRIERRGVGRGSLVLVGLMLCGLVSFAFGGFAAKRGRAELNVLIWSNYIAPSVVRKFEERTGVIVNIETYDSNEALLAKLQAGVVAYDLIVPSDYMVRILILENLLQPLDLTRVPNRRHLDPAALNLPFDPTNTYSLPYTRGVTGIAYRADKIAEPIRSWADLWDARWRGRIAMLDDMREVFAAALKLLGYSLNSTDPQQLRQARDRLLAQKPLVRAYDSANFDQLLLSGEVWIAQAWDGQIIRARRENPNIAFVIPREGTTLIVDNLCIPRSARRPDLAHEFINYLLDPAVAAENMNEIMYLMPNASARPLLREELRRHPMLSIPPDVLRKSEYLQDVGPATLLYDRYWTEVKIAR